MTGEIRLWSRVFIKPIPRDGTGMAGTLLWPPRHTPEQNFNWWCEEQFAKVVRSAAEQYGERPVEITVELEHGVWR